MLSYDFYHCYSMMSYFPYVTCLSKQDRILLFRQCFLSFLVHYYSTIPFHIGEGALEGHLPIKFQKTKDSEKLQSQFRYAPLMSSNRYYTIIARDASKKCLSRGPTTYQFRNKTLFRIELWETNCYRPSYVNAITFRDTHAKRMV